LRRPSPAAACRALGVCSLGAVALALFASHESPFAARALLPVEEVDLRALYLTSLAQDPARVFVTADRAKSTLSRDRMRQAGVGHWIHRYRDPARPGLPPRILLTNRDRGAHLLVPVGALDLERALADPLPEPAEGGTGPLRVESELVHVFEDRLFAGVFLELRFPARPEDGKGARLDFDLVAVRENRARTTDFLLQPNERYYRAALVKGAMPAGPFRARPGSPRELAFALFEDGSPAQPLWLPVSLFDELGLAWDEKVPTLVDDRWNLAALPSFPESPAPRERRSLVGRLGAMHLAARLEPEPERGILARSLQAFLDSGGGRG
jgi:hypothetical protein